MPDLVSVGNAIAAGFIWAVVAVATFRLCFLLSAPKRGGRRG